MDSPIRHEDVTRSHGTKTKKMKGLPDGGVVDVAGHFTPPEEPEEGDGESVAHGVDEDVWHEGHQSLPAQEKGA